MKKVNLHHKRSLLACALALSFPFNVIADAKYDALQKQVELLQQQLQQVQVALKEQQTQTATKEDVE